MFQDTSETESTGGAVGGSEGPPNNGPSLPPGLSPAVAAAAAAAGGVGAHSLLQQTMCQLLRPSSPRGDAPSSPPPLGHPSEPPRSLHWGAQDLRPDLDRQDAHSPPSIDPTKTSSDKGDSLSGTSGFPPKSPPSMGQFNMPAELFQVSLKIRFPTLVFHML
nr:uncharacterized protein LOC113802937 [Penaeus vannamei]